MISGPVDLSGPYYFPALSKTLLLVSSVVPGLGEPYTILARAKDIVDLHYRLRGAYKILELLDRSASDEFIYGIVAPDSDLSAAYTIRQTIIQVTSELEEHGVPVKLVGESKLWSQK